MTDTSNIQDELNTYTLYDDANDDYESDSNPMVIKQKCEWDEDRKCWIDAEGNYESDPDRLCQMINDYECLSSNENWWIDLQGKYLLDSGWERNIYNNNSDESNSNYMKDKNQCEWDEDRKCWIDSEGNYESDPGWRYRNIYDNNDNNSLSESCVSNCSYTIEIDDYYHYIAACRKTINTDVMDEQIFVNLFCIFIIHTKWFHNKEETQTLLNVFRILKSIYTIQFVEDLQFIVYQTNLSQGNMSVIHRKYLMFLLNKMSYTKNVKLTKFESLFDFIHMNIN